MGRDDELTLVRRALGGYGSQAGVVIVGAAGVGKTRLAREALAAAAAAGDRTTWIVGTESARALPLGAFTALIDEDMSGELPNVRRLIDSLVPRPGERGSVLAVDDAHLLDGLSAHVVHQLAQSTGVGLVVTARAGESGPDAVTALWKDGLLARLDLQPLSCAATLALVETALGGPVDSRSARRFWSLTGGNPLYLLQLVKDQVSAGRIRREAGMWVWDGDVAVSQSITDMVGRSLGQLTPGLALVVDVLSQCEPLSVAVLGDLADRGDLEAAERARLIVFERTGGTLVARLAHPLYGELRRATAGEMYLSGLRGRLARRLALDDDDDMHLTVRRAALTLESDIAPDPQLYLRAARVAMTLLDPRTADRFIAAAVDCGATEAVPMRAMSMVLLGRGERADEMLRELCAAGTDAHHWATVRAANLIWMLGRPRDAEPILEELARSEESGAQQAARASVDACLDAVLGRSRGAEEKACTALASGQLADFHAMMASVALVMALGAGGRVDEMNAVVVRAVARAVASYQSSHLRFWLGAVYVRACRLAGRVDECERSARDLAASARDVPGPAYANLTYLTGQAELARGAVSDAVRHLREALAGVEKTSVTTGLRTACGIALAEAHAKLGQPDEARAVLAEARECIPADYVFMKTNLSLAAGWTLAAGGSVTEAITVVRGAAADARSRRQPAYELACLQALVQWGDFSVAPRAGQLADELPPLLADVVARHAVALRDGDGPGLLAVAADYRANGDRVCAADAAAQAGVAFARSGQRKRGLYAAAVARELAAECGGLCTPALRNPAGQPLTDRQREIVEFVVAGLSNREIAARLVMSVRSVEGHLYRACQRVGATSRDELAAVIRAGPPGGR